MNSGADYSQSGQYCMGDVCQIRDFIGLVTLRKWMRVLGLVDVEQLRYQVQLVEEGQRKHEKK